MRPVQAAAVLTGAGVGPEALVQVRPFLASRSHRALNTQVSQEVIGRHEPALTVVVRELSDERSVAEIEAVAQLPS